MNYEQALGAYVEARDDLAQWNNNPGPAWMVTEAENRLVETALVLAAAVAEREGR